MKKLILILFGKLTIFCNGQVVDSVSFYPVNPTTNDTISILCYVQYPNIGCPVQEKSFSLVNDSIILRAFHCGGWQTMICYTVDTFLIPPSNLSPGTYKIYYMPGFVTEFPCQFPTDSNGNPPPYPFAIYTKEIIISPSVSLQEFLYNLNDKIKIIPNPFNNSFTIIQPTEETAVLNTYNTFGQSIHQQIIISKKTTINFSSHPSGVYFLKININGTEQILKIVRM